MDFHRFSYIPAAQEEFNLPEEKTVGYHKVSYMYIYILNLKTFDLI